MLPSLLSTKLFIPEIRKNYVQRIHLLKKLIKGINSGSKLTLVSAPAGYGKTTLALEFLQSVNIANAWISLDEGDNDIVQFLSYLITALKKIMGATGSGMEDAALDFRLASSNVPMTMMINEISLQSRKVILVLDDFHYIHSDPVIDAVKFLLDHQPPNLHIVITTREDPPLPLPRIRAQGRITEIRMEDLCFNRDESAEFLSRVMNLKLSNEAVDAIAERTEGWIAGLQLAGLSLKGCDEYDVDEFLRIFLGTHSYIVDYLVEEVIGRQPEEVREFLCMTSVLGRMSGRLCDAVTGRRDSRLLLRELEKSNLFLIPLDSKREWYRYHHLFADSLRTELPKEEETLIHRKAALWLEENGFLQDAIDSAFRSGDMRLALRLVESSVAQAFENAQLTTFVKWVDKLPGELVKSSEILAVRKAWALLMVGYGNGTQEYIDSLGESFLEKATPHNKGLLLSLRAVIAQYAGQQDAEKLAEEALRFLEPWDSVMRIAALNTLGRAQKNNGKAIEAVKTLQITYAESRKLGYSFVTTLTLMNLGMILNSLGKRNEAFDLYNEYIDGMKSKFPKPLPFIGIVYIGIADLYYECNELEKAKSYMEEGSELCQSIFFNWIENEGLLESRIQFALGDWEAAISTIRRSIGSIPDGPGSENLILHIAALMEFLLKSGNQDEAGQYEETLKRYGECTDNLASEKAYLPYVRLLIYQNRYDEARKLLENIEINLEKTQKSRELITFYLLYSKACFMGGNRLKAKAYFEKAIRLAEPQGYYRLFLDEEPIIKDIVSSGMIEDGTFINRIAEFIKAPSERVILPYGTPGKRAVPEQVMAGGSGLPERLSQRETEILELLVKGMSNDEIAKTLNISINTTQWHISHIYSKLGVRSRTQAILKARELQLT